MFGINLFSGTRSLAAPPLRLQRQAFVPIRAAKSADGAKTPKPRAPRRTRKSAAVQAEPTAADAAAASPARPADAAPSSIHRLHAPSETLRALLERRAERQRRHLPSFDSIDSSAAVSSPAASLRPSLAAAEPPLTRGTVKVRFVLQFQVEYGQSIVVVGGSPELGKWVLADAAPMQWGDGHVWSATVDLPAGAVVEYKYVVVGHGGHAVSWQAGNNSVLALRLADDEVEVHDNWYGSPGAAVVAAGATPVTRESRLLSWASEIEAQVASQRQELRRARMELVAAQEEARVAREESKRLKYALAKSESERVAAVANLKQAATMNQVLQTQLAETTVSFTQALDSAIALLDAEKAKKKAAATTRAATRAAKVAAAKAAAKADAEAAAAPAAPTPVVASKTTATGSPVAAAPAPTVASNGSSVSANGSSSSKIPGSNGAAAAPPSSSSSSSALHNGAVNPLSSRKL